MKVKSPEMLEKMRARMKKAREARSLKKSGVLEAGKGLKTEVSLVSPDSVYFTVVRGEGGLFILRSIEIKGGRIVKEEAGVPNVFGVPMGTIIQNLEDKFR